MNNKDSFADFSTLDSALKSSEDVHSSFKTGICVSVHHHIRCNECNVSPIIGVRYKSLPKDGYNLCQACEGKIFLLSSTSYETSIYYPMIKITHPSQHPKSVSYEVSELLTYSHHNEEFHSLHLPDPASGKKEEFIPEDLPPVSPSIIEKQQIVQRGVVDGKPVAGKELHLLLFICLIIFFSFRSHIR
jgi:hypothetical protein